MDRPPLQVTLAIVEQAAVALFSSQHTQLLRGLAKVPRVALLALLQLLPAGGGQGEAVRLADVVARAQVFFVLHRN
jgi:hypothetical protein